MATTIYSASRVTTRFTADKGTTRSSAGLKTTCSLAKPGMTRSLATMHILCCEQTETEMETSTTTTIRLGKAISARQILGPKMIRSEPNQFQETSILMASSTQRTTPYGAIRSVNRKH